MYVTPGDDATRSVAQKCRATMPQRPTKPRRHHQHQATNLPPPPTHYARPLNPAGLSPDETTTAAQTASPQAAKSVPVTTPMQSRLKTWLRWALPSLGGVVGYYWLDPAGGLAEYLFRQHESGWLSAEYWSYEIGQCLGISLFEVLLDGLTTCEAVLATIVPALVIQSALDCTKQANAVLLTACVDIVCPECGHATGPGPGEHSRLRQKNRCSHFRRMWIYPVLVPLLIAWLIVYAKLLLLYSIPGSDVLRAFYMRNGWLRQVETVAFLGLCIAPGLITRAKLTSKRVSGAVHCDFCGYPIIPPTQTRSTGPPREEDRNGDAPSFRI